MRPAQRRYLRMPRYPGNRPGITIPPVANNLILTDRDDGTLWHVSYTLTPPHADGYGFITINSTIPDGFDKRVYAVNEEPWVARNPMARLIVRGGRLGVEVFDDISPVTDQDQARLIARRGLQRAVRDIISSTVFLGEYAWVPITVEA